MRADDTISDVEADAISRVLDGHPFFGGDDGRQRLASNSPGTRTYACRMEMLLETTRPTAVRQCFSMTARFRDPGAKSSARA